MTPQSCLHQLRGCWTTAQEGTLCFCGLWLGFCVFATASSGGANKPPLHRAAAQGRLSQAHDVRGQPKCQQSCQIQTGISTFAGSSYHLCPHHTDQRERMLEVLVACLEHRSEQPSSAFCWVNIPMSKQAQLPCLLIHAHCRNSSGLP